MKERLFPFGRGLVHAYWAPNFYALYSLMDLGLCAVSRKFLSHQDPHPQQWAETTREWLFPRAATWCGRTSVNTKGIVGLSVEDAGLMESAPTHAVLPSLTPLLSNILVLVSFAVFLAAFVAKSFKSPQRHRSYRSVVQYLASAPGLCDLCFLSAASFFLLSWHVHEKAVLNLYIPLAAKSLLALSRSTGNPLAEGEESQRRRREFESKLFLFCSSLWTSPTVFPLLFHDTENQLKYTLYGLYAVVGVVGLGVQDVVGRLLLGDQTMKNRRRRLLWMSVLLLGCSLAVDLLTVPFGFLPFLALSCCGAIAVHWLVLDFVRRGPAEE